MILDWDRFVAKERSVWERLDKQVTQLSQDPYRRLSLEEVRDLEALYQRAVADLARISSMVSDPSVQAYLEHLVGRAHAQIHGNRERFRLRQVGRWFVTGFPGTFRRHFGAFRLAFVTMLVGLVFGALALRFDPESKEVLMPFSHLMGSPSERVAKEEEQRKDRLEGHKASFSGQLMTHNTQVTITAGSLGITWGLGTLIIMFYNGVSLGAVIMDYISDGQTLFLIGWLLPHGSVEIPAMLVGGQAGFVLAGALLGRRQNKRLAVRMREIAPDFATLLGGAACMLVWAGVVEAFLSQYHEPVIPYWVKIVFGAVSLVALFWYLLRSGRTGKGEQA